MCMEEGQATLNLIAVTLGVLFSHLAHTHKTK